MKIIFSTFFLAFFTWTASSLMGQSSGILIQNVNVIPLEGQDLLTNMDVLIIDKKISSITAHSAASNSRDFQIIDGTDRFLCPGLMDAHPHLPGVHKQGLDMPLKNYLLMQLANGVTALRSMRYEPEFLGIRDSLVKNNVISPRLYLSAPMVAITKNTDLTFDYTKANELFPQYKAQGYDFIKYMNGLNPYTHKSLCEASLRSGLPLVGHLPAYIGLDYALSSGQKGIEHFQSYVSLVDENEDQLREYVLMTKEKGVYNCPTISWYNMYYPYSELDELLNQKGFEYLPEGMKDKWIEDYKVRKASLDAKSADQKDTQNPRIKVLEFFLEAPEMLLLSPGDGDFILPGFSMMSEIKVYKKAGFTSRQILEAASKNAASSLGKNNEWGTIREGLDADLVLLNINPLENIEEFNRDNIEGIFLQGQWLSKRYFDQQLNLIK